MWNKSILYLFAYFIPINRLPQNLQCCRLNQNNDLVFQPQNFVFDACRLLFNNNFDKYVYRWQKIRRKVDKRQF